MMIKTSFVVIIITIRHLSRVVKRYSDQSFICIIIRQKMLISTTISSMNHTIGDRVLLARRDIDINQDELARRIGVSRPYISDIERGKTTNVGVETIYALAEALDVRVEYLLGLSDVVVDEEDIDDELSVREARPHYIADPMMAELLDLIERMDAGQRRQMADIARVLLDTPRIIE